MKPQVVGGIRCQRCNTRFTEFRRFDRHDCRGGSS